MFHHIFLIKWIIAVKIYYIPCGQMYKNDYKLRHKDKKNCVSQKLHHVTKEGR